jgi:hypothetical protein
MKFAPLWPPGNNSTLGVVCAERASLSLVPAPGVKLRYCGRCEKITYCSTQCAKADWAEHKVVCETFREDHKRALAAHEARGGRTKDYNQMTRDTLDWRFAKVPGLIKNELQLLA